MRNIILEGFDGSGKTTLAKKLTERYRLTYQPSEGKAKHPGECNDRCLKYFQRSEVVFDRHPIISNDIYSLITGAQLISPLVRAKWQELRKDHLIIYCAGGSVQEQTLGEFDTRDFLLALSDKEKELKRAYDKWAFTEADIVHRKGTSTRKLFSMIGGFLCSEY